MIKQTATTKTTTPPHKKKHEITQIWDLKCNNICLSNSEGSFETAQCRVFFFCLLHCSDFIWDFGKLPIPTHLGKYLIKIGKIRAKIHEIGKIKDIFGLGMTPIYGLKNGQIKSLHCLRFARA